ncbi:MAG: SdrD B-like domain-containing protein [Candidatus Promineifilaceae bacterium]|nr:SdrD B-like domain-containing protein [Candidatus Promineifilaceae bacterium]
MNEKRGWTRTLWLALILGLALLLAVPGGDAAASGALQTADCVAEGSGSLENLGSLDVRFSCAAPQQVYFGVCDPGDFFGTFELIYQDSQVAFNSFDGQIQNVHIGWADAAAGLNTATLNSTNVTEVPEYRYVISPTWSDVATVMQQDCQAVITTVPPATETILFEQTFTDVFDGQTLVLTGTIDRAYAAVIFRARWPGSTGSLTVFPPSGPALTENDPGVSHNTGPGVDEWTVENPEQGEWTLEFEAQADFNGETVVLGAYTTGAPLAEGENRGSIRGLVFEDSDGDGVRDEGESGLPGVEVIVASEGDFEMSFTTGDDGTYAPVGLGRSYYSVTLVVPEGYRASGPTRYERIDVGHTGRLALGVDFGLTQAAVPAALPATGAGPGPMTAWPVLALALLGGALLTWRLWRDTG